MVNNNDGKNIRKNVLELMFNALSYLSSIMCSDDYPRAFISLATYEPISDLPGKTMVGVNGAEYIYPITLTTDEIESIASKLTELGARKNEYEHIKYETHYIAKEGSTICVILDDFNRLLEPKPESTVKRQ